MVDKAGSGKKVVDKVTVNAKTNDHQFTDQDFYSASPQANSGPLIDYKKVSDQTNIAPDVLESIVFTPKGNRPDPSTYMSKPDIDAHLAKFDEGAVRFTSKADVDKYGTAGSSEAFVLPKSEFEQVVSEARGDLRVVEQKLGLGKGYLSDSNTMAVYIKKEDMQNLRMPSGNEGGANSHWIPGGSTSGGVSEAILDLSETPFREIILE